ncbi:probable UDP-3-O-acyl-N-acetylglucosamine deacetylase 1, mitochondrial isoform X3 [Nymphaea colorata]|uniref:probable UDP-3-O-acyl-N-acetylglucosamine deacetylase 1, mitochondrial isoform X3 n=1 Tax=Nymphaea colorata TaxID=210225 RepID=UPI00129DE536|nr:probable UDP-3-O-acyl-N-acetylglucosamine deacetylase 1, mitochondrial isoform X3 [Nymphaea colorata]
MLLNQSLRTLLPRSVRHAITFFGCHFSSVAGEASSPVPISSETSSIAWLRTGKTQKTLAREIVMSGKGLHSGVDVVVRLFPAKAGEGKYFVLGDNLSIVIPACINFAVESALCTTLSRQGMKVRTTEHLLSALEAMGVDNCRIEMVGGDEVPLLDGSARRWVDAVEEATLCDAVDDYGRCIEKLAPFVVEPVHILYGDSFIAAYPSEKIHITYGINFPQVSAIGCQWFSCFPMDKFVYVKDISSARTFCIYEEIKRMLSHGLVKGGSRQNSMICSAHRGWLNPPLHFQNEPCRHKVLDLIGDLSLLAQYGNQGLPVAHILVYKVGYFFVF